MNTNTQNKSQINNNGAVTANQHKKEIKSINNQQKSSQSEGVKKRGRPARGDSSNDVRDEKKKADDGDDKKEPEEKLDAVSDGQQKPDSVIVDEGGAVAELMVCSGSDGEDDHKDDEEGEEEEDLGGEALLDATSIQLEIKGENQETNKRLRREDSVPSVVGSYVSSENSAKDITNDVNNFSLSGKVEIKTEGKSDVEYEENDDDKDEEEEDQESVLARMKREAQKHIEMKGPVKKYGKSNVSMVEAVKIYTEKNKKGVSEWIGTIFYRTFCIAEFTSNKLPYEMPFHKTYITLEALKEKFPNDEESYKFLKDWLLNKDKIYKYDIKSFCVLSKLAALLDTNKKYQTMYDMIINHCQSHPPDESNGGTKSSYITKTVDINVRSVVFNQKQLDVMLFLETLHTVEEKEMQQKAPY